MSKPDWFDTNKVRVIDATNGACNVFMRAIEFSIGELPVTALEGLQEGLQRLESGRFLVAVVGQMKAGKSTLLNAMLFSQQILPTSATPLTAKLTRIVHHEQPSATVNFLSQGEWNDLERRAQEEGKIRSRLKEMVESIGGDDSASEEWSYRRLVSQARASIGGELPHLLGTQREIPFENLHQYVAAPNEDKPQQGHYVHLTREVEIHYPHPFPSHIDFVDTPGTNDPNELREKVTLDYLSRADAIVLVLYAGQPGQRSDLHFIKEKLLPVGPSKILLALNKFDTIPDSHERETLTTYLQQLVAEALLAPEEHGGEVPEEFRQLIEAAPIFPVSGMRALLGRSRGQIPEGNFYFRQTCTTKGINSYEEAVQQSGILEFEDNLMQYLLKQKGQQLLLLPLGRCRGVLRTLERQSKLALQDIDSLLDNFDKDATEGDREVNELEAKLARIEQAFEDLKTMVHREVAAELKLGKDSARMRLQEIEEEIRDTYSRQIDNFRWTWFYDALAHLNVNLGWRARGANRDVEETLNRRVRDLPAALKVKLGEEIGRWPEATTLEELPERIGELGFVHVMLNAPELTTLSKSDVSVTFIKNEQRKAELKEALRKKLIQYIDGCEKAVVHCADSAKEDIAKQAAPIFDGVLNRLRRQLADIREAAELKRKDPRVIARKKAELQQRREAIDKLIIDTNVHLQIVNELWKDLNGDGAETEQI